MTKNRRPRHREKFWQTRCNAFVCRCTLPTSVRTWTIGLSRLKLSEVTQISQFLFGLRHLFNLVPPNMTQMLRSKFWDNFYNSSKLQCVVCWCKFNWGRGGGLRGDRSSNPLSARRRKRRRLISSLQTFQSADGSLTMGARRVTQEQPHRYATEQDLNGSFKVATLLCQIILTQNCIKATSILDTIILKLNSLVPVYYKIASHLFIFSLVNFSDAAFQKQ